MMSSRWLPFMDSFNINIFSELIKASIEFAERGGNILVDIRKQADIGEQSKGAHDDVKEGPGSNDPVTQGDFQSHMAMTFAFKKYFPTIHVVSEGWLFFPFLTY